MNKIIVPTGYMGSGSSAMTDLISEFEGFDADRGRFEYVFLHCPNGVFDLEDKLLIGNNAIRSDEALHSFYFTMKQLFDKKYWWVGHYNKNISERFLEITEDYIEDLIQYKPDYYWYYQENTNFKMLIQLILRKITSIVSLHKISIKKPLLYPQIWLTYITQEEFYEKTRQYLDKIMKELGINEKNIILDQLLLPFNLFRLNNYFRNNIEVFVVDRDPRDMFLINKYIYPAQNEQVPYPTNVLEFCKCYRSLREMERMPENGSAHVHRFHFEDLIYQYDKTVLKIRDILADGKGEPNHIYQKKCFDPERSINNTQLFYGVEKFKEEVEVIEKMLPDFLYKFPYERKADRSNVF